MRVCEYPGQLGLELAWPSRTTSETSRRRQNVGAVYFDYDDKDKTKPRPTTGSLGLLQTDADSRQLRNVRAHGCRGEVFGKVTWRAHRRKL